MKTKGIQKQSKTKKNAVSSLNEDNNELVQDVLDEFNKLMAEQERYFQNKDEQIAKQILDHCGKMVGRMEQCEKQISGVKNYMLEKYDKHTSMFKDSRAALEKEKTNMKNDKGGILSEKDLQTALTNLEGVVKQYF
ncbi:hypothetical protein ABK040_013942 [Willaertia magna]